MSFLSLIEIQNESLKVLVAFDKICRENHFQYSLAYGTLIGAIRHNGFIPWDDDIDVWMPRKDYDKFIEYCEKNCEELFPLKLCTRHNVENYSYGIPRFSNQEFKYICTNKYRKQFDIGVFIDIYPIDNYCNSEDEAKNLLKKIQRENIKYEIHINPVSNSKTKTLIKKLIQIIQVSLYGRQYATVIDNRVNKLLLKYTNQTNEYVGCASWSDRLVLYNRSDVFDNNNFFNVIEYEFENHSFYILANYNQILMNTYGDYTKMPPINQRRAHHEYRIIKR